MTALVFGFIKVFFKNERDEFDYILVGGFLASVALIAYQGVSLLWWHAPFDPLNFGLGISAILGAMAGGQPLRDRWLHRPTPPGHPAPGMPPQQP